MKRLYLYDDATARRFEPFALTRPVSELRAGAEVIRLRWERAAGGKAYAFIGASHLQDFQELDSPRPAGADTTVPPGSVIVNSRFVVSLAARIDDTSAAFEADGTVCAVRVRTSTDIAALLDGSMELKDLMPHDAVPAALPGRWLNEVWDLIGILPQQLAEDIPLMGSGLSGAAVENATVIGKHGIYLETGAGIEPFVVLDASAGPVLIRRGATVASFTRIVGPCYVGEDSHVVGDAIRGCSIGNMCKVRGEMSSTVMLGHSNKGHTGFVGNSYLGRWVNIGAGTTTSNLKNTYGSVSLWTPSGVRDTGLQFLGSLIGDHAKLGIGTMLTTGCVVGAGANVFGANVTPKYVPPFAWGQCEPWERVQFDKFCKIAERMMERRQVQFDSASLSLLSEAYRITEGIA